MTSKTPKVPTNPNGRKRLVRFNISAEAEEARVIDLAASIQGATRSAWMLARCTPAAQQVVEEFQRQGHAA